jgi:hypothetical protein
MLCLPSSCIAIQFTGMLVAITFTSYKLWGGLFMPDWAAVDKAVRLEHQSSPLPPLPTIHGAFDIFMEFILKVSYVLSNIAQSGEMTHKSFGTWALWSNWLDCLSKAEWSLP